MDIPPSFKIHTILDGNRIVKATTYPPVGKFVLYDREASRTRPFPCQTIPMRVLSHLRRGDDDRVGSPWGAITHISTLLYNRERDKGILYINVGLLLIKSGYGKIVSILV